MTPGTPELDEGTVAFYRTFFEETNEETNQVFEVVTIDAEGALTTVADTRGEFASFGFRPPSLNKAGDVAFLAELDSGGSGIFVGPDWCAQLAPTSPKLGEGQFYEVHTRKPA
jgi:hypothetical protein